MKELNKNVQDPKMEIKAKNKQMNKKPTNRKNPGVEKPG